MHDSLTQRLQALSSAEDFLRFFGVAHDERVVQLNRRAILQRFHGLLCSADGLAGLDEIEMFRRYRQLLASAYRDIAGRPAANHGAMHAPLTDPRREARAA